MIWKRIQAAPNAAFYIVLIIGVIAALCWLPLGHLFPFDDTYITFRYSQHVARGLGIVWNPGGAPTEGYTNFLLMIALVPFSMLGIDLVAASQAIGVFCAIGSGILIYLLVVAALSSADDEVKDQSYASRNAKYFGIFGALLYYLEPFTWMNAYSGLETNLFVFFLLLALWLWVSLRDSESPSMAKCALPYVAVFGAFLTRPEGGLLALVLWTVGMLAAKKRTTVGLVMGFAVPAIIYLVWKQMYFGDLLPNSFYVKVAQPNSAGITPYLGFGTVKQFYLGVKYLPLLSVFAFDRLRRRNSFDTNSAKSTVFLKSFYLNRRQQIVYVATLWCLGLSFFYAFSLLLQPLYGRFTHSLEAMLIITAAIGLSKLYRWLILRSANLHTISRFRTPMFAGLCLVLLAVHIAHAYRTRGASTYFFVDAKYENTYRDLGMIFHQVPHHEAITLAWGDAGVLPYYSEMRSIDVVGLNTNEIARARSKDSVVRFIAAARPDLMVIPLNTKTEGALAQDSCRSIVLWGHGIMGDSYGRLMTQPEFASYKPIALFKLGVYDLDLFADTSGPHFADLLSAMSSRIGQPASFVYAPVSCIR